MAIHRFHCTDGVDLIVDRDGCEISGSRELARRAQAAAEAVMRAVPAYDLWERWSVYVYDERGQVAILPFLPGLADDPDLPETGAAPPGCPAQVAARCPDPVGAAA